MRFVYRTTAVVVLLWIPGCSDGTALTTNGTNGEAVPWFEDQSVQRLSLIHI